MSFFRLKDLIRAVRVCKTAADERNVIRRESAAIRTSFREVESQDARYVNVQKLLYIYLLGFPVQFGQLECLKLAASPRFSDKRVGYLGVTLLLDERQDILTLLTNSLKSDMHSTDDYIVGLALSTLSCVASSEVASDLVDEVERLLDSPRSYLRKKATLAAVRIVRREPELATAFVKRIQPLLGDRHHGVKLAAATLLTELCSYSQEALEEARRLVPTAARLLQTLMVADPSPEHSVGGIADPFLQVALLRLLRTAARGSQAATDDLNDVLTCVATRVDGTRNVGMAVLYECALTVLAIPSEQPLRVLAINLLGRLLADSDDNARYVALATLSAAVITEAPSVQRHRATVIRCMRDDDVSIRRRAVDLSFALISPDTVKPIVDEILRVLPHADAELRPSIVYRLSAAITLFADSHEWHVERMLRVLSLGGSHLNSRDLFKFIRLVASSADEALQRRAARTSFALLERDVAQEAMVIAGAWLVGEYADLLVESRGPAAAAASSSLSPEPALHGPGLDAEGLDILGALGSPAPAPPRADSDSALSPARVAAIGLDEPLPQTVPEPAGVVRLLAAIARSPVTSPAAKRVALMAVAKVAGRFADQPELVASARETYSRHVHAADAEIQARAAEFDRLLGHELDGVRAAVVERMPVPEYADVPYEEYVLNPTAMRMKALTVIRRPAIQPADLITAGTESEAQVDSANKASVARYLFNLMEESPDAPPPDAPAPRQAPGGAADSIADLLSSTSLSPPLSISPNVMSPVAAAAAVPDDAGTADLDKEYDVYNKGGMRITMTPSKKPRLPAVVDLMTKFYNEGDCAMSALNFLVAVPKSQKIQIHPPSGQHISVGSSVTQLLRVSNPTKAALRLRMKIMFDSNGQKYEDTFDFGGFPPSIGA
ncbi:clathrin associated protein complex large subunit [Coemansia biformis]|uniref:AP-1 complex subunit gamma n=1 Tax=Coemansia biformis TaxID=1286918 RepID=A0A9W7YBK4_9FUNG|nr:clathrin associated protein complex large subunit [Coemansia biformis]